jgi:hypothetical protein
VNVVIKICYFFGKHLSCDFVCVHCTPELKLAMQGIGRRYKEAFGTAVSVIGRQRTFPLNVNQAEFMKKMSPHQEIQYLPVLWNAPAVTASCFPV